VFCTMALILSKGEHFVDLNERIGSAEGAGLGDHRETVKGTVTEGPQNKSGKQFLRKKDGFGLKRIPDREGRVSA